MRKRTGIWAAASLLALTATGVAVPTHAQNVSDLAGYSTLSVSPEFETFLTENPNIKRRLQENDDLSQTLLADKSLQAQLLSGKATLLEIQHNLMRDAAANKTEQTDDTGTGVRLNPQGSARAMQNINAAIGALAGQRQAAAREAAEVAEARQEALEALLERMEQENSEALALFLANSELQQQIIDGAASIEEVMADLGVMLNQAEEEALSETTGSVVENQPPEETSDTGESEQAPVDLNRVPTTAEAKLDANGWPKYLNVPEHCAGPRENTEYAFEMRRGPQGEHTPARNDWSKEQKMGLIGNYSDNRTFYLILEDEGMDKSASAPFRSEEIAAPFFTPNADASGRFYTVGGNYNNDKMLAKISECPGDFSKPRECSNLSKLGDQEAAVMFYYHVDTGTTSEIPGDVCVLEPKTQYFFNIQPMSKYRRLKAGDEAFRERIRNAPPVVTGLKRNALIGASGDFRTKLPPYAGPCLLDGGPFPPNYSGPTTSKFPYFGPFGEYTCGSRVERVDVGSCTTDIGDYSLDMSEPIRTTTKCYDPEDKLPPQEFSYEVSCNNGARTKTWLEGYGEPAYSAYVCDDNVCAAHRDGQTRVITYEMSGEQNPTVTEQCQFDRDRQRYDWVAVDHNYRYKPKVRKSYTYNTTPPTHRDTCTFAGTTYPVGTKLQVQCENHVNAPGPMDEVLTCTQRAEPPALPRFIARLPDGNRPKNSRGRPSSGYRLNQCEISVIE